MGAGCSRCRPLPAWCLLTPSQGRGRQALSLEGTLWESEEAPHGTPHGACVVPVTVGCGPRSPARAQVQLSAPWSVALAVGTASGCCVHVATSLCGPFCGPTSPSLCVGLHSGLLQASIRQSHAAGPPRFSACVPPGRSSSKILSCGSSRELGGSHKMWPPQLWSPCLHSCWGSEGESSWPPPALGAAATRVPLVALHRHNLCPRLLFACFLSLRFPPPLVRTPGIGSGLTHTQDLL